jgi:MinD-like ATPase involved in chromosome partitioning or flagellar assembly
MSSLPVFTAVPDAGREAALVAALADGGHGVTVVRRCVDVADLLAAAATGTARAVVLSAELRRLDQSVLSRLGAAGMAVVGLADPGDAEAEARLRRFGLDEVLAADAPPDAVAAALRAATAGLSERRAAGAAADPRQALARRPVPAPPVRPGGPDGGTPGGAPAPGLVIAVWGPTGAPGRTTLAVGLADEAARLGVSTLLIDADVYGGVIAQVLGLLDEAPGLAAAARQANLGGLDVLALAGLARQVGPRLRVLTGISRAPRWPEIAPAAVETVLGCARSLVRLTVVDCGFCLEQDEELSYDTTAPRRNGATLAFLAAADEVLAVGSADPVGVQRLVRGLGALDEALGIRPTVVVNRVRAGAVPGDPLDEIVGALRRFAGVSRVEALPYDLDALDRALRDGRTLAEAAPSSPLRRALTAMAGRLTRGVAGGPAGTERAGGRSK